MFELIFLWRNDNKTSVCILHEEIFLLCPTFYVYGRWYLADIILLFSCEKNNNSRSNNNNKKINNNNNNFYIVIVSTLTTDISDKR